MFGSVAAVVALVSFVVAHEASAIAATAMLCLDASAQQDSAQLGAAPLFVFPGGKGSFVSYWLVGPVATAVVALVSCGVMCM